ncbi:hypothetical protein [Novosphingobium sp. 9U]|uniref:hypothetical protein n=1 Tax=Novosphingobium sp. 9U TaxID=2653158 RepID=UPI0012F29AF4|nr:hypothetical protein [Novosphingobium sp. 9U]VWX54819.1 conserved hypothetical protein [Novosphingobium sp. 9U]
MSSIDAGADRAEERARVAALLASYPEMPSGDLEQVHAWFRRGASALDLGLLASDPVIAPQYRAYRADHYDRISGGDYARAAVFIALAVAALAAIAVLMP